MYRHSVPQETESSLTITAQATRVAIRGEGMTELVGDVLLKCTGGSPTAEPSGAFLYLTIFLFFTNPITSRIIRDNTTEAMLCEMGTCHDRVLIRGELRQPNLLQFGPFPANLPGPNGLSLYHITNLRVNAGVGAAGVSEVEMAVQAGGVEVLNGRQSVALVRPGLAFGVRNATSAGFLGCEGHLPSPGSGQILRIATLRYTEGSAHAFKSRIRASFAITVASAHVYPAESPGLTTVSDEVDSELRHVGIADFGCERDLQSIISKPAMPGRGTG